jgi:hypothetical protein
MIVHMIGGFKMGKDRQEKKLRKSGRVESDRDQSLNYPGATTLEGPESARNRNKK